MSKLNRLIASARAAGMTAERITEAKPQKCLWAPWGCTEAGKVWVEGRLYCERHGKEILHTVGHQSVASLDTAKNI